MFKITRAFILPLIALYLSTPVAAESTTQAWTLSKEQEDVGSQVALVEQFSSHTNRLAHVKNKYFVELKASELKHLKRGDALAVPLPNGLQNFVVTKRQINASGTRSLTARAQNLADGGFVIITLGKNMFHLTAQAEGMTYTGRGYNSVGILVSENDYQRLLPSLDMDEIQVDDSISTFEASKYMASTKQSKANLYTEGNESQTAETVIIDVLFYYTASARELYNNEPQSRIDHLISTTNFIFSESKINVQIRGTSLETDYLESTIDQGLSDMFNERNGFETIVDDRFLNGADAVALLQPVGASDNKCGSAYVTNPLTINADLYALSSNGIDCSDTVIAHELGHNLGLNHSRRQGQTGEAFDFGLGYGVDNKFYTTMAIASDYYSQDDDSLEYKFLYSSPDLSCGTDLPCGVSEGEPDSADAAQAIRLVAYAFASDYDRNPDTTLAIDAIAEVQDENLRSCLEDQLSSNSSIYAAGWRSVGCYDPSSSIADIAGLEKFENLKHLNLWVDGHIDFSVLANLDRLETLHIRVPLDKRGGTSSVNFDGLADKPNLQQLYLEYLGITDIEFLRTMKRLRILSLAGNPIDDFMPLFDLEHISQITLSDTNFPDLLVSNFQDMKHLSILNLSSNQISDLAEVEFPSSLVNLILSDNQLVSAPNVDSASNLTVLRLTNNPLVDISELSGALSLSTLWLGGTSINSISDLASLTNLSRLLIDGTEVSSIDVVGEFDQLITLNVSGTDVSDIGPALLHLSRLDPLPNWGGAFNFQSLLIPCWQQVYGELFNNYWISVYFDNSECFTNDDYADYDGDGIANMLEIDNGLSPLLADSDGDGVNDSLGFSNMLDVDGDGKADIFVRNTDTFYNYGLASANDSTKRLVFGKNSEDIPLYGDFDGDGKNDIAMRRPSTYMWYVANSSDPGAQGDYIQRVKFGLAAEDIPVVADYDGDGKTDFAVYRPSTKMWYILTSSGEGGDRGDGIMRVRYGLHDGDIPVTGDFDGDGKADIAVRRPSTHTWHIMRSGDGQEQVITFGLAEEDIPVPADYDGDGITDLAVRRPSTQMWYILNSSGEPGPYGDGIQRIRFGLDPADIPIVDDYDGDGKADIAVRRPRDQMQYILTSSGEGGDRGDGIMRVRFGLQEKYVPFQAPIHIRMQMVEANNQ